MVTPGGPGPELYWPYYQFNWTGNPGSATVGFDMREGAIHGNYLLVFIPEPEYLTWDGHTVYPGNMSLIEDGEWVLMGVEIFRTGDCSRSYPVPVSWEYEPYVDDEFAVQGVSPVQVMGPAYFAAGQSSTNLSVIVNTDYLNDYHYDNVGKLYIDLDSSPEYQINPEWDEFVIWVNERA